MNSTSIPTRTDEARMSTIEAARRQARPGIRLSAGTIIPHIILLVYAIIALFPIFLIVMNSFKAKNAIFGEPFALPTPETFDLVGYETVLERATFGTYFMNSLIV